MLKRKILFFGLSFAAACCAATAGETIGKVMLLEGKADAVQAAQTRVLARASGVENADVVKTAAASSLQIGFRDTTTCTLGASSELSIDEYIYSRKAADAAFAATLKEGSVRVSTGDVVRKSPRRFRITTPRASIGIRGCLVQIFTGPKEDSILIFEIGKDRSIEIVSKDGKQRKTITQPCLVIIGEHSIEIRDLPTDGYNKSNATLGIAQSGLGGAGGDHGAGHELRNLNDTTYLLQAEDRDHAHSETPETPVTPDTPVIPETPPTYADIDTLIRQAGANELTMSSTAGAFSIAFTPSADTTTPQTFSGSIANGDFKVNFAKASLSIGGYAMVKDSSGQNTGGIFSLGTGPINYTDIKGGQFSLNGKNGGDSYLTLTPNDTLWPIKSGSMSLGSTQGKIDALRGTLNFEGPGTTTATFNTGLK